MTPRNELHSHHRAVTNDGWNIAEAAYLFGEEHLSEAEVASRMGCSPRQAGDLRRTARAQGLLDSFNWTGITDDSLEEYLKSLGLSGRLSERLKGINSNFLELKIFDSGGSGQGERNFTLRLEQFSRSAGRWLKPMLRKSHDIGVSWGTTLKSVVDSICSADGGRPPSPVNVIPTCGELLDTSLGQASSSQIAGQLDEALNGTRNHSRSLAGTPAMIARKFQEQGNIPVVREFLKESPAYVDIFIGSKQTPAQINRIDTILTSVANRTPLRMGSIELLEIAKVPEAEAKYMMGDIGGVLLEQEKLSKAARNRVREIRELWTGIKPDDYLRVANDAYKAERERANGGHTTAPFCPGVVVLAIDENKLPAVLRAVSLGMVSRLACDRHLAQKIAEQIGLRNTKRRA